jgi:hypothetical protein
MMLLDTTPGKLTFRHLSRLTDDQGILEHAKGRHPRFANGYCTDDNARLAIVSLRDDNTVAGSDILARIGVQFVLNAQSIDGKFRNRLSFERLWLDEAATDDCWGRSLWALGVASTRGYTGLMRHRSLMAFNSGITHRSPSLHSMCHGALGAAAVLDHDDEHEEAANFLDDTARMIIDGITDGDDWFWPEEMLRYCNAVVPEALLAAGAALHSADYIEAGLRMLRWLVDKETHNGHLSVTPVGGRRPHDPRPAFDQQPVEVWAIADACARAYHLTGQPDWCDGIELAVSWFLGNNDTGIPMIDFESHGGFDGLEPSGVNLNQGAESTLAMIATMQYERFLNAVQL